MKKMISLSVVVLALAIILTGGSTHSWFIDSVSLPDNVFTAKIPVETKRLYDLAIGDRVVDNDWNWEYRTGDGGGGVVKPVVWIVVSKDHYVAAPAVMLLSSEVVAKGVFHPVSNSLWQDSQARQWVNGTFYDTFSAPFKGAVLPTALPNKNRVGNDYNTTDNVFLLTTTELGGSDGPEGIMEVGAVTLYFNAANPTRQSRRQAQLGGVNIHYWTRTPKGTSPSQNVWYVNALGQLIHNANDSGTHAVCNADGYGYRPALNMDGETLVYSEPVDGVYVIYWP